MLFLLTPQLGNMTLGLVRLLAPPPLSSSLSSPSLPPLISIITAVLEEGKIFGRGTQDMKCVCIQHGTTSLPPLLPLILSVEAIGRYRLAVEAGSMSAPKRTIHLSFLPDEEIGPTFPPPRCFLT